MSRTVSIQDFLGYITDQRQRIGRAFREIEELQVEYQGAYTRFKTEHDRTLAALADQVEALAPEALPPELGKAIDARVPVERRDILDRVAALDKNELPKIQKQADTLLAESQKQMADLRALNPKLNDREEKLKVDLSQRQKQLEELNAQVSRLGRGLGFVWNVGKIYRLDQERYRLLGRIESLAGELNGVRQEWKQQFQTVEQEQTAARTQWQKLETERGQLREERDYLSQNTETLARRRAIVHVLDSLKTSMSASDSMLKTRLAQMVELNTQTDAFQAALGSVAGILGSLRGVDEGLNRFGASVTAVIEEQQRHSAYLSPPRVEQSDKIIAFGNTWDELAAKSKDEKKLAGHPADFVAAMKPFLAERLTTAHISAFFEGLGQALQQATSGWGSK